MLKHNSLEQAIDTIIKNLKTGIKKDTTLNIMVKAMDNYSLNIKHSTTPQKTPYTQQSTNKHKNTIVAAIDGATYKDTNEAEAGIYFEENTEGISIKLYREQKND
jgi:hypothetical protein